MGEKLLVSQRPGCPSGSHFPSKRSPLEWSLNKQFATGLLPLTTCYNLFTCPFRPVFIPVASPHTWLSMSCTLPTHPSNEQLHHPSHRFQHQAWCEQRSSSLAESRGDCTSASVCQSLADASKQNQKDGWKMIKKWSQVIKMGSSSPNNKMGIQHDCNLETMGIDDGSAVLRFSSLTYDLTPRMNLLGMESMHWEE